MAASFHRLLEGREMGGITGQSLQRHAQSHRALVERLAFDCDLRGHQGCVNRLAWSEDGSHLASGSDDTNVFLWDYGARRAKHFFDTGESPIPFGILDKCAGMPASPKAAVPTYGRVTSFSARCALPLQGTRQTFSAYNFCHARTME